MPWLLAPASYPPKAASHDLVGAGAAAPVSLYRFAYHCQHLQLRLSMTHCDESLRPTLARSMLLCPVKGLDDISVA